MVKSGKNRFNVVFIGHVDAGKSTTSGRLIHDCGGIDKRTLEKYEKESADIGKASFKYAWVLDKSKTERERGITVDAGTWNIETDKVSITIVDAPGHKDFMKNMITGTACADYPVLVVPASQGEGETAIGKDGSTREHATLAYTLGIKYPCVAINKMDTVGFSEARFDEIKNEVFSFLTKVGFPKDSIACIPISGFHGDNLTTKSERMPWFKGWSYKYKDTAKNAFVEIKGHTIVDWLNTLNPIARPTDKPLRIPVSDAYKVSGVGTVVIGRVESGILTPGMTVSIAPSGICSEVKSVEMHHEALEEAVPGDSIGFNVKNIAVSDVRRGHVAGDVKNDPPRECKSFTAQLVVIRQLGKVDSGVRVGYSPIVDCHTSHIACRVSEILSKIDKRTGKPIQGEDELVSKVIRNGEAGIVTFCPNNPMCVETFSEYSALGRFAVRDIKCTVAVGVIKGVEKKEPDVKGAGGKAGGKASTAKAGAKPAGAAAGGKKAGK